MTTTMTDSSTTGSTTNQHLKLIKLLLSTTTTTVTTPNDLIQLITRRSPSPSQSESESNYQNQNQNQNQDQDLFESVFPLPFRILSIFAFTLLSWALVLHLLRYLHLNPSHLLYSSNPSSSTPTTTTTTTTNSQASARLYQPVYHASLSLGLLTLIGLISHQLIIKTDLLSRSHALLISALPGYMLLIIPLRLAPFSQNFKSAHRRLHNAFKRIFTPAFPPSLTPFSDIILADLLTSLSRPIGNLGLLTSSLFHVDQDFQRKVSIGFNALPYLLRFKQCMNDLIVGPGKMKSIMNGIKYSTAIPMIVMNSKLSRSTTEEERNAYLKLWIVTCLINSIYSTWWDIVNDWGINRKEIVRWYHLYSQTKVINLDSIHHQHHQAGRVLFSPKVWWGYLVLMIINSSLRMSWMVGIWVNPIGNQLAFMLEVLEVFRRSIWCLVRIEWGEISRRKESDYHHIDDLRGALQQPAERFQEPYQSDDDDDDGDGDGDGKADDYLDQESVEETRSPLTKDHQAALDLESQLHPPRLESSPLNSHTHFHHPHPLDIHDFKVFEPPHHHHLPARKKSTKS